jgi:hypothetical protein
VQYFSVIEAQRRLAPHLHATIRGAIPRAVFRQVVAATDFALWWPAFDQAVYVERLPEWTGPEHGYADPDTGELLPTWQQALDALDADPDASPAHVMRFGIQLDLQGVIPEHAEQAIRYLAKYLTKAIGETHSSDGNPTSASSSTPSANGNAGAPSTRPPRPSLQEFRQLLSRRDRLGVTTARPHPMTRQIRAGGLAVRGERSESRSDADRRP